MPQYHYDGKLDLRSQIYEFLMTPGYLYFQFISWLMGVGWTGPEGDDDYE